MFVRFVIARTHPDTGVQAGIFEGVSDLRSVGVPKWDEQRLDELRMWLREHLPLPDRVARSRRPNGHHAAVSWFKDSATEHIDVAREYAAILNMHDIRTEMITSERPGYVVYEDEFQVLAEPFRSEHPVAAG
ncbi:MAG: hypothetical protein JWO05_2876 [Gemmatimonadetes bacterium]|nr:hypothetical protein [Gemmatimonadota bacterium]